jgi:hypothetical protein
LGAGRSWLLPRHRDPAFGRKIIMAAGAKPGLDPNLIDQTKVAETAPKPTTLMEKIVQQLTKIFEHNERLGSTRQ